MEIDKYLIERNVGAYIIGIEGKITRNVPLNQISLSRDIEFSQLYNEADKTKFMAAAHFVPYIDITFVQRGSDISIVTYCLNNSEPKQVLSEIVEKTELELKSPSSFAILEIARLGSVVNGSYTGSQLIATTAGIELDEAFAFIHYVNFIKRYSGLKNDEQHKKISERFKFAELLPFD